MLERVCREKGIFLHWWWECKLVQPLWRTLWRFCKKLKIELPYDPTIPFLGIYPERNRAQKDTYTLMFIAALFTRAKIRKQPKYLNVLRHTHTHTMEYYSAIKKNEIRPFVGTWVDLEITILSEVSQTERKYCMTSLLCEI